VLVLVVISGQEESRDRRTSETNRWSSHSGGT